MIPSMPPPAIDPDIAAAMGNLDDIDRVCACGRPTGSRVLWTCEACEVLP